MWRIFDSGHGHHYRSSHSQKISFGTVIDAQAAGDLAVLESRGRCLHLGTDVRAGLKKIAAAVNAELA